MEGASSHPGQESETLRRIKAPLDRMILAGRWLVAPLYLGLLGALFLVAVKFLQKLVLAFPRILSMDTGETILLALTLIDLALVGNLLMIVMFTGWETYVGPPLSGARARGMSGLDFSAVKLKLFASMTAIGGIQALETLVHIDQTPKADAMWQLAILLGIAVIGVLLAWMDRIGGEH